MNPAVFHRGRVTSPAPRAPARREYHSPLRRSQAEQTRAAVIDAATRRFSENGWAGTGVRDIAAEAGVSVETVYAAVGTKAQVLEQALDVAIVGDDEPVDLTARPEFQAMSAGDLRARTAAAADLSASVNERTVGLLRALREAAAHEPALAARLEEARSGHRATVRAGATLIAGRAVDGAEADGLWAVLSPETFELLTGSAGWSTEQYRRWLAGAMESLLGTRPHATERQTDES
jgi:AcrR family transcriptional regulator